VWENQIEVFKFFSPFDNCGNSSFVVHFLQGVGWLSLPKWV
jgi:hypothetical protein